MDSATQHCANYNGFQLKTNLGAHISNIYKRLKYNNILDITMIPKKKLKQSKRLHFTYKRDTKKSIVSRIKEYSPFFIDQHCSPTNLEFIFV